MQMAFRLTNKLDLTPDICSKVLEYATDYCKLVPEDVTLPWEILNVFINFSEGKQGDPQFWIAVEEDKIKGFMVTQAVIVDKRSCCYIRQAYVCPKSKANGLSKLMSDKLMEKAKKAGYDKILCQRYGHADAFARLISKFGFKYKATEFEKEIPHG